MISIKQNINSTQSQQAYDVIISGAGPVGLFLACELALSHCSVLILEKAADPGSPLKQVPFGIRGLSAPTIEAFYRRGLLDKLELHKRMKRPHQNTSRDAARQAGHFAGIPFYERDVDTSQWPFRLSGSTGTSLISEMEEIETILTRHAETLGVEIRRGFAITDFQQTGNVVNVQSNDKSFQGKWLVGCDGSRSVVRKKGGFEFAGTEPEFTGYTTLVDMDNQALLKPGRNVTATGMYLQSQPGFVIIQDFDGGAFHDSGEVITAEHVQKVLRRISDTDITITKLHVATTWTDRSRQATAYRNGRVFLAGDAAHIHAPLGGQGLNLGLGDAMNLGWKLAAAIRGNAPENLLDSYFTERYPIGVQVLDWSRAQVAIMRPDPYARALNAIIRDLINTRDGATYFAGRFWGVSTHYNLQGGHRLAGYSVPDFEFEDGVRLGELMHNGQWILIDFINNISLKKLTEEFQSQMKYVSGRAKEQFGISALMIRPDGFVCWASDQHPDLAGAKAAAMTWLTKTE